MDSHKLLPKVKNLAPRGYAGSSMNLSTLKEESRLARKEHAVNLRHLDMSLEKLRHFESESERVKNFDLKKKSGKDIVDYVSSFGRQCVDLFVHEVKQRDMLLTKAGQRIFLDKNGNHIRRNSTMVKAEQFSKVSQLIYEKLENHRKSLRAGTRSVLEKSAYGGFAANQDLELASNTGRSTLGANVSKIKLNSKDDPSKNFGSL